MAELDPEHPLWGMLEAGYFAAALFDPVARPGAIAEIEPLRQRARHGRPPENPALCAQLALREANDGAPPELVRKLVQAALAGDPLVEPVTQGRPLGFAVAALVQVDELELAEAALAAALEAARAQGLLVAAGAARHWRALVHYRRGRLHEAIVDAEVALRIARSGWATMEGWSAAILAHARIETGEIDGAREAVALGEAAPAGIDRALVLEARGRLALIDGEPAAALTSFEAAGRHLADHYRLWHPGMFAWRRAAALPPLRRGLELADRFAARPLAETALAELRASGARPRRVALSGADALTPTERRIAELAAAGRANPQIANALYVTTKTVEWHLSHVYSKLTRAASALRRALAAPQLRPATRGFRAPLR